MEAITGQKIIPGLLDRYLGKSGYDSQQIEEREDPGRPNNLYEPVDERRDYGPHGTFGDRAEKSSAEVWVDMNRDWIVGGAVGAAALVFGLRKRKERSEQVREWRKAA